jgi:rsbT co-antagonist protein RsbR
MAQAKASRLSEVLKQHEASLLSEWLQEQSISSARRDDLISLGETQEQSRRFLSLLVQATQSSENASSESFSEVRNMLGELSRSRARQGFSPAQVASFVLSLKKPIFARLQQETGKDVGSCQELVWSVTEIMDALGLHTIEVYQQGREEVIARQQQEMLELSTPVVKLWDGVLALPLIGTLDSARTQVVMESLLEKIVSSGSEIAIIDITGVPTVDTLVAQHLMKTVAAARLMGADCIISGIRPQIAQTIVHLGVELKDITTKASLASAFLTALGRTGYIIRKNSGRTGMGSTVVGEGTDRNAFA